MHSKQQLNSTLHYTKILVPQMDFVKFNQRNSESEK